VGGDQAHLQIKAEPKTKLSIVTQGHTKILESASRDKVTRQGLDVTIETDAAICLLPDPVQPFEGSVYEQSQIFTLAEGSSVCLLDWVSNGRPSRGEDWDCLFWSSRNEIWAGITGNKTQLVLKDNLFLQADSVDQNSLELKKKMYGLGLFGTLILKGPFVESLASFFMAEFALLPRIGARDFESVVEKGSIADVPDQILWRAHRLGKEKDNGILWSAAKIRGCTVVKFGASNVEGYV
jgi:urease accessory protein